MRFNPIYYFYPLGTYKAMRKEDLISLYKISRPYDVVFYAYGRKGRCVTWKLTEEGELEML